MTQKQFVLNALKNGHSVTVAKMQFEFRVMRLADVILKLRQKGHRIKTTMRKSLSGQRYAEYSL